jgi:hypothetical protein
MSIEQVPALNATKDLTSPFDRNVYRFRAYALARQSCKCIIKHLFAASEPRTRESISLSVQAFHKKHNGVDCDKTVVIVKGALSELRKENFCKCHKDDKAISKGYYVFIEQDVINTAASEPLISERKRKNFPEELRYCLASLQDFRCGAVRANRTWGCRNLFGPRLYELPLRYTEKDHIVALGMGGSDTKDNMQLLCLSCHKWKSAVEDNAMSKAGFDYRRQTPEADTPAFPIPEVGEVSEEGGDEEGEDGEDGEGEEDEQEAGN